MDRPVIGISTYVEDASWGVWSRRAALLPWSYVEAVGRAAGAPVLIPPSESSAGALGRIDGLVIAGGPDVDPRRYAATRADPTLGVQPHRDAAELDFLRQAVEADLPVLGVCRGMQLINVLLGGSLIQHLPDEVGHIGHRPTLGAFHAHEVTTGPGTRLRELVGPVVRVPTYHHQGVDALGSGLRAAAWADDGVVEALEAEGPRFLVGVQWHPEEGRDARIFAALVAAARKTREHR